MDHWEYPMGVVCINVCKLFLCVVKIGLNSKLMSLYARCRDREVVLDPGPLAVGWLKIGFVITKEEFDFDPFEQPRLFLASRGKLNSFKKPSCTDGCTLSPSWTFGGNFLGGRRILLWTVCWNWHTEEPREPHIANSVTMQHLDTWKLCQTEWDSIIIAMVAVQQAI